jgi:hypothetical protein
MIKEVKDMAKVKVTYTKAQIKKAEKVGIPVEDLHPDDPWGVLELFDNLMAEADEIVKKYKKEG